MQMNNKVLKQTKVQKIKLSHQNVNEIGVKFRGKVLVDIEHGDKKTKDAVIFRRKN